MAGMPGIPQPVDDPEIEIFELRPALGRDVAHIRRIGSVADAITERGNMAVLQDECGKRHRAALPFDGPALAAFDEMTVQDRRIFALRWRHEAVCKPQQD